jgi:hypothetical protein
MAAAAVHAGRAPPPAGAAVVKHEFVTDTVLTVVEVNLGNKVF